MPRILFVLPIVFATLICAAEPVVPRVPDDDPPARRLDDIPRGLDRNRPIPADNPLTDAKVLLGRKLFFDPILSSDKTVSCASCHLPQHGFAGPDPLPAGVGGKRVTRNAPTLFNRAYGRAFFWDGRESSLEAQALRPIENPIELGAGVPEVLKRLQASDDYRTAFQTAFPDGVSAENLARALACYQRTLLHGDSGVDRFRAGDIAALTEIERHGLWLFESKSGCWRCHGGHNFTDELFHNTGVNWEKSPIDLGRYAVTKQDADRGRFKTPTLRAIANTAPYMHDGSVATLKDVVEFYNRGGGKNAYLDPMMSPLNLSPGEVDALVAFMKALSK